VRDLDLAAGVLRVLDTKNGDDREVPLPSELRSLLGQCAAGKKPSDHLISREDGRPVGDFRKAWRSLLHDAGVKHVLVHDLRRTAASDLRRSGVDETTIMKIGGWRTASVFRRYSIVTTEDTKRGMEKRERYAQELRARREQELEAERATEGRPN